MAENEPLECTFIQFVGKRVTDVGTDHRDSIVCARDSRIPLAALPDGTATGNLGLRADASLLAVSNRFGALFAGTPSGFRFVSLAALRETCEREAAEKYEREAAEKGVPRDKISSVAREMAVKRSSEIFNDSAVAQLDSPPCALALSADDTWLALCSNRTVFVFEVATVLGGGHGRAPVITQPLPGAGELLMWEWSPAPGALRALALDDQGELHVMTFALPGSAGASCCCVARDPTLCSAAWASDGQSLICGTDVGQVVRFAPEDGARCVALADAPHASIGGPAKLGLVRPLAVKAGDPLVERPVVLLAYEPTDEPDAPKVAALDLAEGQLQGCGGPRVQPMHAVARGSEQRPAASPTLPCDHAALLAPRGCVQLRLLGGVLRWDAQPDGLHLAAVDLA